jgi:hypothetical protein
MSRIGFCQGWLLYVGNLGSRPDTGLAISGDVADIAITMEQGITNVTPFGSPHQIGVPGHRSLSVQAEMGYGAKLIQGKPGSVAMGEALQSWPDPDKGRAWPPQFRAMAGLARRHPGEYQDLLAAEVRSEPLQVVRNSWLDG